MARAMAMRWRWPPDNFKSAFAHPGAIALRHLRDEIMRGGVARGLFDLGFGGAGTAQRDIVGDAFVEQYRFLGDHADGGAQGFQGHVMDVLAVDGDQPAIALVETQQQIEDGALARARRPHQRDFAAGGDIERDPVQDRTVAIGKSDIVESDGAAIARGL